MAQNLEIIVGILREMGRANESNSNSFNQMLLQFDNKISSLNKEGHTDLAKAYLNEIVSCIDASFSVVINNFSSAEDIMNSALEGFNFNKDKSFKRIYESFSKNMQKYSNEAEKNKKNLSEITKHISEISSENSNNAKIISQIKKDLDKTNNNYKALTQNIINIFEEILTNIEKSNATYSQEQQNAVADILKNTISYLEASELREAKLEKLISHATTQECLKLTQSVIEKIIDKTDKVSDDISNLADKEDVAELQSLSKILSDKLNESETKKNFSIITEKADSLVALTDDVKQSLAQVTRELEDLKDTSSLDKSLQNLFQKLESLDNDIKNANGNENFVEVDSKIATLSEELSTIKNIIADLNEVITSKIITTIDEQNFKDNSYEMRGIITELLNNKPSLEDISKIICDNTKTITEKIDELPTKQEFIQKTSNIESLIEEVNYDKEFDELYTKTASLETWLKDSKIKENTEEIVEKLDTKADQKDTIAILEATEKIVSKVEDLTRSSNTEKVTRTMSEVSQLIEDIKSDFATTIEMHNDSTVSKLAELQKNVENLVSVDEFDNFVEDLKAFVLSAVSAQEEYKSNFEEVKNLQESILSRLSEINFNSVEETISQATLNIDEKLDTISSQLSDINKDNSEDVRIAISEIREILENKKSNFHEIEQGNLETVSNIENYLREIKVLLDTSDNGLNSEIQEKLSNIETALVSYQSANENALSEVIVKLEEYQNLIKDSNNTEVDEDKTSALNNSIQEIDEIKNKIEDLAKTFSELNFEQGSEPANTSNFVAEILNELGANLEDLSNNVDDKLQQGFVYNAELIEEKTDVILNLVKDLRHENTDNIDLYERLTVTDNKLMDFKQELEFINTDVISNLNSNTTELLNELAPLKDMLANLNIVDLQAKQNVKTNLSDLHDSVQDEIRECTKYSQSTFEKIENSYNQISQNISDSENNLRDFILGDIDSVIIKIDDLRTELEESLNRVSPPDAEQMGEFKKFVEEIAKFKGEPSTLIAAATQEVKESLNETIKKQHEELKSMLAVSINNEEIVNAINNLQEVFKAKVKDLNNIKASEEDSENDDFEDFEDNQYDKAFEPDKNAEIIEELKQDFDKFSEQIKELSENNEDISEVLEIIKTKMNSISIQKPEIMPEIVEESDDENSDETVSEIFEDNDEDILVGSGNFDFNKAFELLKLDIKNLHNDVEKIITKDEQKQASSSLKSIPTLGNDNMLLSLNNKIETLTQAIKPRDWLDEIKTYIAGDDIQSMLQEISGKIDILTLTDNSEWVDEIKQALEQLNTGDNPVSNDPKIQTMLTLINEKIDILAANDDSDLIEEVRDAIERIDNSEETGKKLDVISNKIDVIATTNNDEDFEDIKDSVESIEDQFEEFGDQVGLIDNKVGEIDEKVYAISDNVKKLSESDAQITTMLETLNHKIDSIDQGGDLQGFEDVKALIMAQTDLIEDLEKNGKTEAVKKCLKELTAEVNNLASNDSTKQIQKTIREMKESILSAVIAIFDQVSFVEESEDIKDFVEEKTDEINQNLVSVTNQLKQITNSTDDPDYIYSMQDIESDLAKLRLTLNRIQESDQEIQAERLTSILENINNIGTSVEDIQNSMNNHDDLKVKVDRVNTDVMSLNALTNQLIAASDKSYNAMNSSFESFEKVVTNQLTNKVDRVTKLLETSNHSDKVMREALIYMGEWIDSASASMNKISTNSDEIVDIKTSIEHLKDSLPEQTEILNSIEEKFDEQQERLAFFEKQIHKLGNLEDKFEAQQERIDRLEMSLDKILTAVEDIDDSKVSRKIDKIEKQLAKLGTNIEKLASYVD